MTPTLRRAEAMRANIVGAPDVATRISASMGRLA